MSIIKKESMERLAAMLRQAEISAVGNTDEQALRVPELYTDWETLPEGTSLKQGQRLRYQDILYKVLTDHDKQAGWAPDKSPSLFAKVLVEDPEKIPAWEQPESTNGYAKGDRVTHNGKTWESLADNNVWEPGAQGTEELWVEVKE